MHILNYPLTDPQIVYFFYPETANLTLEEIDFLFTDRSRTDLRQEGVLAGNDGVVAATEVREDHVKE